MPTQAPQRTSCLDACTHDQPRCRVCRRTWHSACLCNAQQEAHCQEAGTPLHCRHARRDDAPRNGNATQHCWTAHEEKQHVRGYLEQRVAHEENGSAKPVRLGCRQAWADAVGRASMRNACIMHALRVAGAPVKPSSAFISTAAKATLARSMLEMTAGTAAAAATPRSDAASWRWQRCCCSRGTILTREKEDKGQHVAVQLACRCPHRVGVLPLRQGVHAQHGALKCSSRSHSNWIRQFREVNHCGSLKRDTLSVSGRCNARHGRWMSVN